MRRFMRNAIGGFLGATLLAAPTLAADLAQPGTINYVEGEATIGVQSLDARSVGSGRLRTGQTLSTLNGKAEILLTPGVFVRIADNSSLTMISPDLANTEVRLVKGRAIVEVAELHKENNLVVEENGGRTQLMKTGLYDFDADRNLVRVFEGQAMAWKDGREVKIKGGREFGFNGPERAQKFDKTKSEDSFYRWASLRSEYLAEANVDAARFYEGGGYAGVGVGWYWDPWFGAYTFLPGDGIFYSPFGWSYYSPGWAFALPFGYYGHAYHHFDRNFDRDFGHRALGRSYFAGPRFGSGGMRGFHSAGAIHGGSGRRR